MKFSLGKVNVEVKADGQGVSPWGNKTVYRYKVTVSQGKARYTHPGWGSIRDYEQGVRNYESLGASLVSDLLQVVCDPDEYIDMCIGEEKGRAALTRGKAAEKFATTAKKFNEKALRDAVEEADKRGLL